MEYCESIRYIVVGASNSNYAPSSCYIYTVYIFFFHHQNCHSTSVSDLAADPPNSWHWYAPVHHRVLDPDCIICSHPAYKSVSAISRCCRPMFPLWDVQWAWISFTPNWEKNIFYTDMALCTRASSSCWNRKGPSPNCFHSIVRPLLSGLSLYAAVVRPPFKVIRTKEPNSNHGKQHLFLSRVFCSICHQL